MRGCAPDLTRTRLLESAWAIGRKLPSQDAIASTAGKPLLDDDCAKKAVAELTRD